MRTSARLALSAALALCVLGCSYDINDVSYDNIRRRPAPEMSTTALTKPQSQGSLAYMNNTNLRGSWDDFKRTWFLDNPSQLSPYPIVNTSGDPR